VRSGAWQRSCGPRKRSEYGGLPLARFPLPSSGEVLSVDPSTDVSWSLVIDSVGVPPPSPPLGQMDSIFFEKTTIDGVDYYRLNTDAIMNFLLVIHYQAL